MVLDTAIVLVFMFAVLVMFHELGHFIAARAVGIRVEEFAFGFGPKIARLFKRGDTEYTIHPFPIGGFVKLAGMEPGEDSVSDGFQAQSSWKRALVIFAGPFASFVLAVVVFLVVGVFYGFPDSARPANRVGMVVPKSEAKRIGLRAGDSILSINGHRIKRGREMTDIIHSRPGQEITLVTQRPENWFAQLVGKENAPRRVRAVPQWTVSYLGATWSFQGTDHAKVEAVGKDSPAEKAGISEDDELVSIGGSRIVGGSQMVKAIEANGGKKVALGLMRAGKEVAVQALPQLEWVRFNGVKWSFPGGYAGDSRGEVRRGDQMVSVNGVKIKTAAELGDYVKAHSGEHLELSIKREGRTASVSADMDLPRNIAEQVSTGYHDAVGLLGFLPEPSLVKVGFAKAISQGLSDTWENIGRLLQVFSSPKELKDNVGGPLMIGKVTYQAVSLGAYWVLSTLGGLSLSLAFINLVPIPAVLDGGHLILIAYEALRRKRLTREQMQAMQLVGLAMVVALFFVIMYSDVTKIWGGQAPQ